MKKIKIVMFAVVVIAIAALNAKTVLNSNRSYDLNTTTITAISGEDDPIDGGEIGGVEIKCDKGGSGDCYAPRANKVDGSNYCRFYCEATGTPSDYCNSFWMGLLELCTRL